jgi:hypothetical protein
VSLGRCALRKLPIECPGAIYHPPPSRRERWYCHIIAGGNLQFDILTGIVAGLTRATNAFRVVAKTIKMTIPLTAPLWIAEKTEDGRSRVAGEPPAPIIVKTNICDYMGLTLFRVSE